MLDEYAIRVLTMINVAKRIEASKRYEDVQIAMVPNMDKSGVSSLLKQYEFQAIDPTDLFNDSDIPSDEDIKAENAKVSALLGEANKKL